MNILAIDTTTTNASVSIQKENNIFKNEINNPITHSEKLLPLIDKTLKEANMNLKDVSLLACLNGPGSFTGIRIGLSTIKAFSQVNETPIFSISSLEAIAYLAYLSNPSKEDGYYVSMLDAKNGRVYYSIYELDNNHLMTPYIKIGNDMLDTALSSLSFSSQKTICFAGNLGDEMCKTIQKYYPNSSFFSCYPTASDLIQIYHLQKNPTTYNAYQLNAIYARPSQAERIKNETH